MGAASVVVVVVGLGCLLAVALTSVVVVATFLTWFSATTATFLVVSGFDDEVVAGYAK